MEATRLVAVDSTTILQQHSFFFAGSLHLQLISDFAGNIRVGQELKLCRLDSARKKDRD
jgi:hypothetical protein